MMNNTTIIIGNFCTWRRAAMSFLKNPQVVERDKLEIIRGSIEHGNSTKGVKFSFPLILDPQQSRFITLRAKIC